MTATMLNTPIYRLLKSFKVFATVVKRPILTSYIVEGRLPWGHFLSPPEADCSGMAAISKKGEVRTAISNDIFFLIDWLAEGTEDSPDYEEQTCPYCVNQVLISSSSAKCPECNHNIEGAEE